MDIVRIEHSPCHPINPTQTRKGSKNQAHLSHKKPINPAPCRCAQTALIRNRRLTHNIPFSNDRGIPKIVSVIRILGDAHPDAHTFLNRVQSLPKFFSTFLFYFCPDFTI